MYIDFEFFKRDLREYHAVIYYILKHTTKNNKELDFYHFWWLFRKMNDRYLKRYYNHLLPDQYLVLLDEYELKLNNFNCNWKVIYKTNKKGLLYKKAKICGYQNEYSEESYLSETKKEVMDYIILLYNFYGKYFLNFVVFIDSIIYKIKNLKLKNFF